MVDKLRGDPRLAEIIARLSHEVRHPVSAMLGMIELLAETPLDPAQQRYVDLLRGTVDHLLALLSDAFDPRHDQGAAGGLARVEFRVHEVVEQAVEIAVNRIRRPAVVVTSHVDPSAPRVVIGDPGRLRQVLLNLLINALKFTEQGEVFVDISCTVGRGAARRLVAIVTDTGIGIDAARVPVLTAPSDEEPSHAGLGLKICRELVGQLGGTLGIESAPGQGTTVRVEVPVEVASRQDSSSLSATLNLAGHRAVVLAESPTQRKVLVENVRAWGGEAVEVRAVDEALALLSERQTMTAPVDILIVDDHQLDADADRLLAWVASAAHLADLRRVWVRRGAGARSLPAGWNVLDHPIRRRELAHSLAGEVASRRAPRTPQRVWPPGRTFRVLVVDDTVESLRLVRFYLESAPLVIEEARSGPEAIAAHARARADLVLLDLQMPGMSGIDTARALRSIEAESGGPRARIVFFSAAVTSAYRSQAIAIGADACLEKPAGREALLNAVHRQLCGGDGAAPPPDDPAERVSEAVAALVPAFLRGRRRDLGAIRDAVARGDFGAIRLIAHTMKGLGGSYGFPRITELGAELEEAAGRGDAAAIGVACAALEAHLASASSGAVG